VTAPTHVPALSSRGADSRLVLRGWTGEFFQIRELDAGDLRLWHPDGSYYGRLITDDDHTDAVASGTVFGPSGLYLANAVRGRLRVNPLRRHARSAVAGLDDLDFASPGDLAPVERSWPRRG
jgi:hypothetical protein